MRPQTSALSADQTFTLMSGEEAAERVGPGHCLTLPQWAVEVVPGRSSTAFIYCFSLAFLDGPHQRLPLGVGHAQAGDLGAEAEDLGGDGGGLKIGFDNWPQFAFAVAVRAHLAWLKPVFVTVPVFTSLLNPHAAASFALVPARMQ